MNDPENLVRLAAKVVGISPTTLLLALGFLHLATKVAARMIPDDKTSILGSIRKTAGVIGVEPSSCITDCVSIKNVATATITAVPEVAQRAAKRVA